MTRSTFRIWRGEGTQGAFADYATEVGEGMVVLDAVHQIQAESAGDLAMRWNCKAGKCGSCSAEVNGRPRLMCMTRLSDLDLSQPVSIEPMRAFPPIRDLVTDVSWNYEVKKRIRPFKPENAFHARRPVLNFRRNSIAASAVKITLQIASLRSTIPQAAPELLN